MDPCTIFFLPGVFPFWVKEFLILWGPAERGGILFFCALWANSCFFILPIFLGVSFTIAELFFFTSKKGVHDVGFGAVFSQFFWGTIEPLDGGLPT